MPIDERSRRGQLVQQFVESPLRFASTLGPLSHAPVAADQRDATEDLGIAGTATSVGVLSRARDVSPWERCCRSVSGYPVSDGFSISAIPYRRDPSWRGHSSG